MKVRKQDSFDFRFAGSLSRVWRSILLSICFPLALSAQISCDLQWFQLFPPAAPDLLIERASAYDSRRGVAVLFGGDNPLTGILSTGDTWEFNGAAWTKRALPFQPPARKQAAMAYDSDRGVCVLFGGGTNVFDYQIPFNDTWEWNGITWAIRQSNDPSAGDRPPPLDNPMMAYDSVRKRMVLLGSYERAGGNIIPSNRTWEWDGNTWTVHDRFTSASPAPPPRSNSAMAFDPIRRVTVVFGGTSVDANLLNDTWVWDGIAWKLMPVVGISLPGKRDQHAMAFDADVGEIVLFGGSLGGPVNLLHDTWEWDGVSWTNLPQANQTGLFERRLHNIWYDSREQRLVVFGGTISKQNTDGSFSHTILNDLYEARTPGRWVDFNFRGKTTLDDPSNFYGPYITLGAAVDAAPTGCAINLKAGSSAETITITKPLILRAYGGPVTIGAKLTPN